MLSDVTRLKLQQVQLEALALERELMAERTRAILDSVLVGIVTVGSRGIEWMNRSARRMFGGELADFVGEPMARGRDRRADHPFRRTRLPRRAGRGPGRDLRVPRARARRARVLGRRQRRRDRPRRQRPAAHLRAARHRAAAPGRGGSVDRRRRRCSASSRRRRWRSRCSTRARCSVVQVNAVAAATIRRTPERPARQDARADASRPTLAAARRARHAARARLERGDDARVPRQRATAASSVWDARLLPLVAGAGRAARPAAARRHRRHRAARRAGGAPRGGDRAARDAGQGSAPPDQEQPAGRRRAAAADRRQRKPEVAAAIAEVVGQVQAIAQVYGLQVGADGPLPSRRASRRSPARCSAPSGARSAAASPAPAPRAGAARGRGDPDRADDQRAAHQRDQAQRAGERRRGDRLRARLRRERRPGRDLEPRRGCRAASTWRASRAASRASAWCARCCRERSASLSIEQAADVVVATVVARRRRGVARGRRHKITVARAQSDSVHDGSAGATSKGKILVVDDNRLVLATLTDGLTQRRLRGRSTPTTATTRSCSRAQHRPDLALLDIRMEGKSGFDVAAVPARRQCQMPFMFLSAFSDEQTVAQVKALGAVAYLVKPLDIGQIVPAVEAAFAHLEAQAQRRRRPRPRGSGAAGAGSTARPDDRDGGRRADAPLFADARRGARAPAAPGRGRQAQPARAQAELLLAAVEQLAGPARH